jgi:hypothetical protein
MPAKHRLVLQNANSLLAVQECWYPIPGSTNAAGWRIKGATEISVALLFFTDPDFSRVKTGNRPVLILQGLFVNWGLYNSIVAEKKSVLLSEAFLPKPSQFVWLPLYLL